MVNWYYVVGSERVGPISLENLKKLFLSHEINLDTYVWKKGFQNWERYKDVKEFHFDDSAEPVSLNVANQVVAPALSPVERFEKINSPEIVFNFDWNKIKESEDLFFVRIGKDRKDFDGFEVFGPYTQQEIKEGINERRMNFLTLIYSPGMSSWTKIQDTPFNENFKGVSQSVGLNEVPLLLVLDYTPLPLVTVVKKTGTKNGVLLGSGPFVDLENKTIGASLYMGNEIKAKNIKVKIHTYDKKEQSMECQFMELNQDAKRIMLNHAV